ncbi:hypothetical protein [Terrabacter sp. C0L_2]|uniref:hypothetical protein n=1 Tax=Terrabacter sp. C0L_2 TaxID=3108389 RepID=UPI001805CAA1|nr:hypothetical protein [Dermatophilaceae bacterium]WVM95428.1 hypothetical protein U5C87_15670 [Terrabacter sp. C0L_2]
MGDHDGLALTVGLLAFLALDAGIEGLEVGAAGAAAFGGSMRFVLGEALAFLLLARDAAAHP